MARIGSSCHAILAFLVCIFHSFTTSPVVNTTTGERAMAGVAGVRNSSLNHSPRSAPHQPFECIIKGLSEEDIRQIVTNNDTVGILFRELTKNETSEFDAVTATNVELEVINNTVIVRGNLTSQDVNVKFIAETECELSLSSAVETSKSGSPPRFLSSFDHVILMNGAPDQVIGCSAAGDPVPLINWIYEGVDETRVMTLSADASPGNQTTSYLYFAKVLPTSGGNYTCIAENEHAIVTKRFEVEVVSLEPVVSRCKDSKEASEQASSTTNAEFVFEPDVADDNSLTDNYLLDREKRNLWIWVQKRGTKYPPASPPANTAYSDLQKMVNFIAERLLLADKVAVNKWDNDLPVEDLPREQIILENMVRQAEERGLDTLWARRFFRDQIEGNKDIQFELIDKWKAQGRRPYGPPVDLANDVRPKIDQINNKLIELAAVTITERSRDVFCKSEVEKNARYAAFLYNLSPLHQTALQRATRNVCLIARFGWNSPVRPNNDRKEHRSRSSVIWLVKN